LLLAAPSNRIFGVGDDDQTIYGWRLADVRRILALAESLPGLKRIDLTVNYRCPPVVVERAVRLVARNEERFIKTIRPVRSRRAVSSRPGRIGRDGPNPSGDRQLARRRRDSRILARTTRS